jgi:hypothetical protein
MVDMCGMWMGLGLNMRRWWFLIFKVSWDVFHLNKPISSRKCEHKLAYNVGGAIW